jgi:alpha-D-ribose 1-methylphosphonate 5-triphosphate diphosphatase
MKARPQGSMNWNERDSNPSRPVCKQDRQTGDLPPMTPLPDLRLTGALVLTDGALQDTALTLSRGRIADHPAPEVDLSGYWLLPGIVDLHGDGFEHHLRPRPTAPFDTRRALLSADAELAAAGVTTAWFAQSWSWEGGTRSPDRAEELMQAVAEMSDRLCADIRVKIRL